MKRDKARPLARAFMSDERRRPVGGKVDRLRFSPQTEQFVSAAAYREAERILAETEPIRQGFAAADPPVGATDEAREALAEAISQFLGEG